MKNLLSTTQPFINFAIFIGTGILSVVSVYERDFPQAIFWLLANQIIKNNK